MALRHQVFVQEQGVPVELEQDELDAEAHHFLLREEDRCIACARAVSKPEQEWKIGRVAVALSHRGQGLGLALMRAVEDAARLWQQKNLVLDAQLSAQLFYEKMGYRREGETFLDAGIEHRRMRRSLPGRIMVRGLPVNAEPLQRAGWSLTEQATQADLLATVVEQTPEFAEIDVTKSQHPESRDFVLNTNCRAVVTGRQDLLAAVAKKKGLQVVRFESAPLGGKPRR